MQRQKARRKYSGKDGDLTWSIDSNGLLTVTGSGDYEGKYTYNNWKMPEWLTYRSDIKTAKVQVTRVKSFRYFFWSCKSLTKVDFAETDTSQVTDMSHVVWKKEIKYYMLLMKLPT